MRPGDPYQPANGTGADFMAHFCDRCERGAAYQRTAGAEDGCPILLAAICPAFEADK